MKTFDIRKDISGSRLVIYPGGTEAKRAQGHYVDAPYIWVHFSLEGKADNIELIRAGHVQRTRFCPIRHWDDVDETINHILQLMREL